MTVFATTPLSVLPLGFNEHADERDEHGRFKTEIGRDVVYDLVKDIALRATSGDVTAAMRVTTRAWNEARAQVDVAGPETASAVTWTLDLPWRECLSVSLLDPSKRAFAHASRLPGEGRDASDDLIRRALRAVAHRLKVTPSPDAYDRGPSLPTSCETLLFMEVMSLEGEIGVHDVGVGTGACRRP